MTKEKQDHTERFETIITLTIAVVSVVMAFIGGWSSLTDDEASGAMKSGISAAINREKASVISHTWMFQDIRAYTEHQRLNTLVEVTTADAEAARLQGDDQQARALGQQVLSYRTEARAFGTFFAEEYVLPDGSFDEEQYLQHQMRFEVRNLDVNPEDDFQEALVVYDHAFTMVIVIRGLAVSVTALILARITKGRLRFGFYWLGLLVFIGFMFYMAFVLNWIG